MIGDKGNESYNVSATTLTAAVKAGLARLQMAVIPRRIVVRRL